MKYKIQNNEAHIFEIISSDSSTYFVPEHIEENGVKYPVSVIRRSRIEVERLFLPKTIKRVFLSHNKYLKEVHFLGDIDSLWGLSRCPSLEKVQVHGHVTSIGGAAFSECRNLKEVIIDKPGKVEVHCHAFSNCAKLERILVNNQPIELDFMPNKFCPSAFSGCYNYKCFGKDVKCIDGFLLSKDGSILYTIVGKNDDKGEYIIPKTVKDIYHGNCYNGIKKLDFSESSLGIIEDMAFQDCINLLELVLPSRLIKIGNRTFDGCYNLSKIINFQNISELGPYAFRETGITECLLSSSIENIPEGVFSGCVNLKKIEIPISVKSINSTAFNECNNIKYVRLPIGYKVHLQTLFKDSKDIEISFSNVFDQTERCPKQCGAYTHGHMSCPYCGTSDVRTFCDGTAECNKCGGEYVYWRLI